MTQISFLHPTPAAPVPMTGKRVVDTLRNTGNCFFAGKLYWRNGTACGRGICGQAETPTIRHPAKKP